MKISNIYLAFLKINIMAFLAMMLISCENNIKKVQSLVMDDTTSAIVADDITFIRSDSGVVLLRLIAPKMLRQEGDSGVLEFPSGFEVDLFNNDRSLKAHMRADYGISMENNTVIHAEGNVEIENFAEQRKMNSDKLFWYQDEKMVYTRSAVKITMPDKVVLGDSLTAADDFSTYIIHHVIATIAVDDDDLD